MWYWRYREALLRVKFPRHYIQLDHGTYDYVPSSEEKIKKLTNQVRAKKGKVTEYTTKLQLIKNSWNEIFPIEDDIRYKNTVAAIDKKKFELAEMEAELKILIDNA